MKTPSSQAIEAVVLEVWLEWFGSGAADEAELYRDHLRPMAVALFDAIQQESPSA
jgi:hypothetical protein